MDTIFSASINCFRWCLCCMRLQSSWKNMSSSLRMDVERRILYSKKKVEHFHCHTYFDDTKHKLTVYFIWCLLFLVLISEYYHLKNQIESEQFTSSDGQKLKYFRDLPKDEQQSKLKDRLKKYCQKVICFHSLGTLLFPHFHKITQ